ncbi:MAG: acyltransferase [Proteobacteria bacterium]|nr:MAG: acyltransferase [Pseudomonadota bacterium]
MDHARPIELKTLTSLRFFAAMLVVLTHTMPLWLAGDYNRLPFLIKNVVDAGIVAVPFFFTLSGFVLYYVYGKDGAHRDLGRFYQRRLVRIAPAAYLGIALGVLAWANTPGRDPGILLAIASHAFFLSAWLPSTLFLNFPAWSLSGEVFFYLGFPWAARMAGRLSLKYVYLSALALYLLCALGFKLVFLRWPELSAWPWKYPLPDPTLSLFFQVNPFVHIAEFLWGVLLARFNELNPRSGTRGDWWLAAGITLSFAVLQFPRALPYLVLNSFLLLPFFSLVLLGGAGRRSRYSRWLESSFCLKLGEASFALYILHMPLRDLVLHSPIGKMAVSGWGLEVCFCLVVVLCSLVVHQIYEYPLRAKVNQAFKKI